MLAQTLGFGIDKQGTESFAGSSSPLGDLSRYVGPIMSDAINFGVMVSAFASALGTATAGSRMLFALCRDGFLSPLGRDVGSHRSPRQRSGSRHGDRDSCLRGSAHRRRLRGERFLLSGHYGVLSMLIAYIVTNVGALRFLFLSGRVRAWEAVFPVIALVILVYVIYANVYPVPDFPFSIFPYVVKLGW